MYIDNFFFVNKESDKTQRGAQGILKSITLYIYILVHVNMQYTISKAIVSEACKYTKT